MSASEVAATDTADLFTRLGLYGLSSIQVPVLASLASETPLLLTGSHGCGKSLLLERIATALGLEWRPYNASLLNFDDLVGYPLPDEHGQLRYVQTPASVWGAEAVFVDEISRARVDIQNRLFPIIHEKRVQGIALALRIRGPCRPTLSAIALNSLPWPCWQSSTACTSSWVSTSSACTASSKLGTMKIWLTPSAARLVGQHSPMCVLRCPEPDQPIDTRTAGTTCPRAAKIGVMRCTPAISHDSRVR